MKKFYLIRHGQSAANAGIKVYPNPDIPLTEFGYDQAAHLAHWLCQTVRDVDAVFVSPYLRTQQTAEPYLDKTGFCPEVLPCLQEFDMLGFKNIASLSFDEIRSLAKAFWLQDNDYKDSADTESFNDFAERVQEARQVFSQMTDGTYVAFTHGMWIGMLIWQLMHQDDDRVFDKASFANYETSIRPNNCSVYLLTIDDNHHAAIAKVHDSSDPFNLNKKAKT